MVDHVGLHVTVHCVDQSLCEDSIANDIIGSSISFVNVARHKIGADAKLVLTFGANTTLPTN